MTDAAISVLVVAGSLFMLLAAVGVTRMPDLYMRLSAMTKGPTMGVGLLLIATVIETTELDVILRAAAILGFGFFASPIAAHMISRAAYFQGVALWHGTVVDELHGRYERESHVLQSPERTSVGER